MTTSDEPTPIRLPAEAALADDATPPKRSADQKRPASMSAHYPSTAQIVRAYKAAKAAGMSPAGFKVEPNGAIVVFDASTAPIDEYEQWQANRPA